MLNLKISPQLEQSLRAIAQQKHVSVETAAEEALQIYVREQAVEIGPEKTYSFIGIARSGKGNISTQVEENLQESADRKSGWSVSQ